MYSVSTGSSVCNHGPIFPGSYVLDINVLTNLKTTLIQNYTQNNFAFKIKTLKSLVKIP